MIQGARTAELIPEVVQRRLSQIHVGMTTRHTCKANGQRVLDISKEVVIRPVSFSLHVMQMKESLHSVAMLYEAFRSSFGGVTFRMQSREMEEDAQRAEKSDRSIMRQGVNTTNRRQQEGNSATNTKASLAVNLRSSLVCSFFRLVVSRDPPIGDVVACQVREIRASIEKTTSDGTSTSRLVDTFSAECKDLAIFDLVTTGVHRKILGSTLANRAGCDLMVQKLGSSRVPVISVLLANARICYMNSFVEDFLTILRDVAASITELNAVIVGDSHSSEHLTGQASIRNAESATAALPVYMFRMSAFSLDLPESANSLQ